LAAQKNARWLKGISRPIMFIFCSPFHKYSISQAVGFIKGKSAIQITRNFQRRKKTFVGQHIWARWYYVSTVGKDKDAVRDYIQKQEKEDNRIEQLKLF
jgi:putative transposase